MKDVRNRTRDEIGGILKHTPRPELLDLIFSLSTCEPHYSPAELAKRRGLHKETILRLIKQGVIAPIHAPTGKDYRIPLSSILDWDRRTALSAA